MEGFSFMSSLKPTDNQDSTLEPQKESQSVHLTLGDTAVEFPIRKLASPKNSNKALIESLNERGIEPVKEILNLMPELSPKEQVYVYMDLLAYLYPKLRSIEVSGNSDKDPIDFQFKGNILDLIRAARG